VVCARARASGARRRAFAGTTAQKQSESPACSFSITPRESARKVPGARACPAEGRPMVFQGSLPSFVALRTWVWLGALERWLFDGIF
jgi:hypothetical protein